MTIIKYNTGKLMFVTSLVPYLLVTKDRSLSDTKIGGLNNPVIQISCGGNNGEKRKKRRKSRILRFFCCGSSRARDEDRDSFFRYLVRYDEAFSAMPSGPQADEYGRIRSSRGSEYSQKYLTLPGSQQQPLYSGIAGHEAGSMGSLRRILYPDENTNQSTADPLHVVPAEREGDLATESDSKIAIGNSTEPKGIVDEDIKRLTIEKKGNRIFARFAQMSDDDSIEGQGGEILNVISCSTGSDQTPVGDDQADDEVVLRKKTAGGQEGNDPSNENRNSGEEDRLSTMSETTKFFREGLGIERVSILTAQTLNQFNQEMAALMNFADKPSLNDELPSADDDGETTSDEKNAKELGSGEDHAGIDVGVVGAETGDGATAPHSDEA